MTSRVSRDSPTLSGVFFGGTGATAPTQRRQDVARTSGAFEQIENTRWIRLITET